MDLSILFKLKIPREEIAIMLAKTNGTNVKVKPIPLHPITIRDRFRKFIGLVSYL